MTDSIKKALPMFLALTLLAVGTGLAAPANAACPDPLPEGTVCVEWTPPVQNTDGSELTDLAGYELWVSTSPIAINAGNPRSACSPSSAAQCINIMDPLATEAVQTVLDLPMPGPEGGDVGVYVRMTAYDEPVADQNSEFFGLSNFSELSNEVYKVATFPDLLSPEPPQVLQVIISIGNPS